MCDERFKFEFKIQIIWTNLTRHESEGLRPLEGGVYVYALPPHSIGESKHNFFLCKITC